MSKSLHTPISAASWPISPVWSRLDAASVGVFDCPHTTPVLVEEGLYVVRSQDIRGRVFDWRNAGKVTEATYQDRIARAEPRYGDLLYSREGTYFGIAAEVPKDMQVCLGQRMVLIRPDANKLYHRFLLYWLNSPVMDAHLGGFRDGSVAERLNMTTIRALPVPLLPLCEQREIAAILGALDDKIEVNRKTSATLEEMARALYRSWFVDFDPVWAKLEGRQPAHMNAATAALFPDSFDDNGLPAGWTKRSIYDVASVKYGAPFSSSKFNTSGEGRPLVRIRDLKNGIAGVSTTEVHRGEYLIQPGDIVVGMDGDFTAHTWLNSEALMNQRVCCFLPVAPEDKGFVRYALPALLKAEEEAAVATTVIHLGKKDIDKFQVVVATPKVKAAFGELVNSWMSRVIEFGLESRTLATLRDTLLPRLMSGELRVGEARELVEEVA